MTDNDLNQEDLASNENNEHIDGDRGLPALNDKSGNDAVKKIAYIVIGVIALAVMAVVMMPSKNNANKAIEEPKSSSSNVGTRLPDSDKIVNYQDEEEEEIEKPAAVRVEQVEKPARVKNSQPTEEDKLRERRQRAPIISFGSSGKNSSGGSRGSSNDRKQEAEDRMHTLLAQYGGGNSDDDYGMGGFGDESEGANSRGRVSDNLKASKVETSRARILGDRNFLLTKGTFLDCALETAIDTTVSGFTACRLTRNVYSDNGKVLLLERGSRITGEYQSEQFKPGMNRLFVLWDRVTTPNGVAVDLDSPGIDELGRSGYQGKVNNHFLKRFGAAIMLSLMDDYVEYKIAQQRGGNELNFSGTTREANQLSEIVLKHNISIPPTLYKDQGTHIKVYLAKDIDFSDVYHLTD